MHIFFLFIRSIFQKQMYPTAGSNSKLSNYSKMNSPTSVPKSPRMKQYSQSHYSSPVSMSVTGGNSNMPSGGTDYNYNNISANGGYSVSSMYGQSNGTDQSHMMNSGGDSSPINNTSPYSACSLSPGSTPTTNYQNGGSSSAVNNTWPYQSASLSYNDTSSQQQQLSSYNQSRHSPTNTYNTNGNSNPYSSLNGSMWGSMGTNGVAPISDSPSQMGQHTGVDHSMKVG